MVEKVCVSVRLGARHHGEELRVAMAGRVDTVEEARVTMAEKARSKG